ncbi:hypothetical protein AJ80_00964 [Polytolypa hystricis UAMH7299]|uniref:Helicase C-terminal domain-containing protein n=1 Tax=Polytolypa hystricis (strain UAMH7299) TaxID=1447883 RepID=A0A2B7YT86_POLH7|nr:hypothetical protein AJ80_00964 [Polytolypa hystricis UAMH7299]
MDTQMERDDDALPLLPPGRNLQQECSLSLQLQTAVAQGTCEPASSRSDSVSPSPQSASPARSLTSTPCTPPASSSDTILKEDALLQDLNRYIAVGVLRHCNQLLNDWVPGKGDSYPEAEVRKLRAERWIRTETCANTAFPEWSAVRVYILPDDIGRKFVSRSSVPLRRCLKLVISKLDTSPEAWEGQFDPHVETASRVPEEEDESLFYIFNTLESPNPDVDKVSDPFARKAMEDILWKEEGDYAVRPDEEQVGVFGLKTPLYAYQRRSAAYMIQRESEPAQTLDPRLQAFNGPTGQLYYYDREEGSIVLEKRLYSEACGGILAETMGFGKTLISLAVILATRGHFPRIPSDHMDGVHPVRQKTASLLEMAAAAAGRYSLPWGSYFDQIGASGMHFEKCLDACERNRGAYTISAPPPRYRRRESTNAKAKSTHLKLCSGTLVIVPLNLVDHWLREIDKHTQGLRVLVLRDFRQVTPSPDELMRYDIILFSRFRFDYEASPSGPTSSRLEGSPLKKLHWLRIIVDEGHNFARQSGKSNAVHILDNLHVERRWVVSGTPSSGLYGVEVSLASQETGTPNNNGSSILQSRKRVGNAMEEEAKNIDRLKLIVVGFLNLKPWANSRAQDPANWKKYIKPAGPGAKGGRGTSLRSTLQSLVVRHRSEDINKDLTLPKLYNKVVHLEPTFHDKLTLNMFLFQIVVNAITSERKDGDYMFDPRNRRYLSETISNLRHAGFWWMGFEKKAIQVTIDIARKYFEENCHRMSGPDLNKLSDAIGIAEKTIRCSCWEAFNQYDELGVFVEDFPDHARSAWAIHSLLEHKQPLLMGTSRAVAAQKFVTSHLCAVDPAEGLVGAGLKARHAVQKYAGSKAPSSSEPLANGSKKPVTETLVPRSKPNPSASKKSRASGLFKSLSPKSPLAKAKLVATASAKLTYLMDKVVEFQEKEKIIIFYEHNNTAYWIAEGLELLGVEFRIYANTLPANQRSEYLRLFNETEVVRVFLMDLSQAAHGLHIACASRVFIVNPIWDPNIESQAIKRAHRISQTKPVYVETLVLRDTLEDKMLRRRKQMSNAELQHAERDPLDDQTMSYIIQNEGFIPMPEDESSTKPAYLKTPPGFFDRHKLPIPRELPPAHGITYLPSRSSSTSNKRKRPVHKDDRPWIQSDILPHESNLKKPPRKRRASSENESVASEEIITEPSRTRTPPVQPRVAFYPPTPPEFENRDTPMGGVFTPGMLQPGDPVPHNLTEMASHSTDLEDPFRN